MAKFYILKSDGREEYWQDKKLLGSLLKSKLDLPQAQEVLSAIKKEVKSGMPTSEIRQLTFSKLCKLKLPQAQLYNLRAALAELPPKTFERYIMRLLEADNYVCEWEKIVPGAGTSHEVDVVARKGDDFFLIECKRRANPHKISGLGKVLQLQARFEDILDGNSQGLNKYKFTRAWLINNAKFSDHAENYASYKKIWLTGWGYPKDLGLNNWIQFLQVYPVTLLRLSRADINRLINNDILTFKDMDSLLKEKTIRVLGSSLYERVINQIAGIKQCR